MKDMESAEGGPKGLLHGVRVVELGQRIAAPLVGMVLAEQGAEVVRVLDRSYSTTDPVLDALLARGKTEVVLDLDQDAGRAMLRRLLVQADVVVENLPTGRLGQNHVRFDAIRVRDNPGLISCSIPPFPADDPRSALPDYEAVAGMAGFLYEKPLGKPLYHDFPVGSVVAGLLAANAIVAALIARLHMGRGQHIETTLFHSNLFSQILQILIKTGVPRGFLPFKMIGTPFMGPWLCGDDRYIYLHITLPAHNARILEILESIGYGKQVRALKAVMSPETMRDPSQVKSIPEAKRIRRHYERIFLTRPADEWEQVLGQELCCIKIRTIEEWLGDSIEAGMTDACRVQDPVFGEMMAPGPAIASPDHPPVIRPRLPGEEAFTNLLTRWESQARIRPVAEGLGGGPVPRHPLQGIRVIDLSRVIAGPCAARVLAELGAEVLTIQSPTRLDWALSFHLVFNTGKRSVTLDFTTDEGKRTLWRIMEDLRPHAFIQNYRHLDIARAIGVDPDAMRSRFPDIVYTHLNAYGNEGAWKDRPGFEQVVQAVSGIQMSYGRHGRPRLLPTPIVDIGSGLLGAFATLLGLYHHKRTGEGVFATTHLTQMSVLLQLNRVAAFQRSRCLRVAQERGVDIVDEPGREIVAEIFRALDAYMCLVGPRADLETWLCHAGLVDPSLSPTDDPLQVAAGRMWKRPVSYWQGSLASAGLSNQVVILKNESMRRLHEDIRRYDRSPMPPVRKREYPGCPEPLTFVRNPIRLSLTPIANVSPPPERGAHTREVLARVGERVADRTGVIPYPSSKPLLVWLANFIRWGYFAWRSGNI